jgi:hypothetical protein
LEARDGGRTATAALVVEQAAMRPICVPFGSVGQFVIPVRISAVIERA